MLRAVEGHRSRPGLDGEDFVSQLLQLRVALVQGEHGGVLAGVADPLEQWGRRHLGAHDQDRLAASERQRVERVVAAARSAGAQWASLRGPESPAELTEGSTAALHLASGTMLTATVDPWSGGPPYGLQVAPTDGLPTSRNFADRAEWLAEYRRCRTELAAAPPGSAGTPAT